MTCWCQIAYLLGTSRKAINRASLTQIRVHHHCNCFPTVVYDSRNRSKNLNGDKRTRSGKYLHFHISGAFGNGDSGLTLGDTVRISSRCNRYAWKWLVPWWLGHPKYVWPSDRRQDPSRPPGTRALACFRCQVWREVYINDKIVFVCSFCGMNIPYESRKKMISHRYHQNRR